MTRIGARTDDIAGFFEREKDAARSAALTNYRWFQVSITLLSSRRPRPACAARRKRS